MTRGTTGGAGESDARRWSVCGAVAGRDTSPPIGRLGTFRLAGALVVDTLEPEYPCAAASPWPHQGLGVYIV